MNVKRNFLEGLSLSLAVSLPMILFVLIHKEYLAISNEQIRLTGAIIVAIIGLGVLFLYIIINRPRSLSALHLERNNRSLLQGHTSKNYNPKESKSNNEKKHSLLEYVFGFATILLLITVLVILLNLFIDRNSLSERQVLLIVTIFSTSLATFEAFTNKTYIGHNEPFIGKLVKFIQISGGPPGIIKLLFFV